MANLRELSNLNLDSIISENDRRRSQFPSIVQKSPPKPKTPPHK